MASREQKIFWGGVVILTTLAVVACTMVGFL